MDSRLINDLKSKIARNKIAIEELEHQLNKQVSTIKKNVKRGKRGLPGTSQTITQVVHIGMTGPSGDQGIAGIQGKDGKPGEKGPRGDPGIFNPANIYYGPGIDGDKVISEDTILTSDLFCSNLVVEENITLRTNDFRIHVQNTLINKGIIHNNGSDLINLKYSGSGGGINCQGVSCVGMGGDGGSAAGSVRNQGIVKLNPSYIMPPDLYYLEEGEFAHRQFGAGGGGSEDSNGGSGAGSVIIFAREIVNDGIISASGEKGEDGIRYGSGGGGGGYIGLLYDLYSGDGKILCSGGKGGSGSLGSGEDGQDGIIIKYDNLIGEYIN